MSDAVLGIVCGTIAGAGVVAAMIFHHRLKMARHAAKIAEAERDAWHQIAVMRSVAHAHELYFVARREDDAAREVRRAERQFTVELAEMHGWGVTGAGETRSL